MAYYLRLASSEAFSMALLSTAIYIIIHFRRQKLNLPESCGLAIIAGLMITVRPQSVTSSERIAALEEKLKTKNEVRSELLEEHVAFKKGLGEI